MSTLAKAWMLATAARLDHPDVQAFMYELAGPAGGQGDVGLRLSHRPSKLGNCANSLTLPWSGGVGEVVSSSRIFSETFLHSAFSPLGIGDSVASEPSVDLLSSN